jgi:CheY-like chemotaxis protein
MFIASRRGRSALQMKHRRAPGVSQAGIDRHDIIGMEHPVKRAGDGLPAAGTGTGLGDIDHPLRRRADVLLAGQKEAYELVLAGASLGAALEVLARTLEVQSDGGLLATLLVLDDEGLHLTTGAQGSVSPPLQLALGAMRDHGLAWQAIRTHRMAGTSDLRDGEAGEAWRDLAREHGLHAAWSLPVAWGGREPVGAWLLFQRHPGTLSDTELATVREASQGAALMIEHDRRQRRRAQDDRDAAKSLSVLAHDLRNPLAPLRNTVELLNRAGNDPALVERASAIMSRQLSQLARLLEELSDFSNAMPQGGLPPDDLPHAAGSEQQLSLPDDAFGKSKGALRVLVADDNELVRESFVELLRAEGYDVETAVDGVQAVEIADQWRPQAVLLDIHMPRLSGLETARRLRAAYSPQTMTLMMMSGMALNDAWMRHAKAAGFDDCVDKTADPKVWLARLKQALKTH